MGDNALTVAVWFIEKNPGNRGKELFLMASYFLLRGKRIMLNVLLLLPHGDRAKNGLDGM